MSDPDNTQVIQLFAILEALEESKERILKEGLLSQHELDIALEKWNDILKKRCENKE